MEHIRRSIDTDIDYVAAHMRKDDVAEVMAWGHSPRDALALGFNFDPCFTMVDPEGNPAGMLGVNGDLIWLLGTPSIEKYAITFLRQSKPVLKRLYEITGNELLWNWTYKHNHLHHKWLKWLGFTFLREEGDFIQFVRLKG